MAVMSTGMHAAFVDRYPGVSASFVDRQGVDIRAQTDMPAWRVLCQGRQRARSGAGAPRNIQGIERRADGGRGILFLPRQLRLSMKVSAKRYGRPDQRCPYVRVGFVFQPEDNVFHFFSVNSGSQTSTRLRGVNHLV